MSRAPQLEPAWLIGLLIAWSRRETRDSGLGYYTINPMLRDGIPCQARSYEPTGYGGTELDAIGRAVNQLRLMRKLAVMRYCRPWMAGAIDRELERVFAADTWLCITSGLRSLSWHPFLGRPTGAGAIPSLASPRRTLDTATPYCCAAMAGLQPVRSR